MAIKGYLVRDEDVVWRDIAGEIVILGMDNNKLRVLNKTASLIWTLADGSKQFGEMVSEISNRFEVTIEQARTDAEEFCNQLLGAGLVSLKSDTQIS
jgi:hypothetical protein